MKTEIDFSILGKIVLTLIIGSILFYMIFHMVEFGDRNMETQTQRITEIIDKALVQCYALEGCYPPDIYYLSKYGVMFQDDKYIYHYEMFAANIKPTVKILDRNT